MKCIETNKFWYLRLISDSLHPFLHLTRYYYDDKHVEDGLGGNLGRTDEKCMQNLYGKYLKERDHTEDLSIDGNMLKCRVGFIWMRIGISGGFL
jgi:hypothetical protein